MMPDYRIGSFTGPGQTTDADPIVVYFGRLPGGGDVSGDLQQVIAAVASPTGSWTSKSIISD
jgi:hypothetical protein